MGSHGIKHGMTGTPIYRRWSHMKERCNRPSNIGYKDYGGRGITVCEEWQNDFVAFYEWSIANGYADNLQLDRRDNSKGYSPDNCRYVEPKVNYNNKRDNTIVNYNGVTRTAAEWSRKIGVSAETFLNRIYSDTYDISEVLIPAVNGHVGADRYRFITINDETRSIREWARISGLSHSTIRYRLAKGITGEALIAPPTK